MCTASVKKKTISHSPDRIETVVVGTSVLHKTGGLRKAKHIIFSWYATKDETLMQNIYVNLKYVGTYRLK